MKPKMIKGRESKMPAALIEALSRPKLKPSLSFSLVPWSRSASDRITPTMKILRITEMKLEKRRADSCRGIEIGNTSS